MESHELTEQYPILVVDDHPTNRQAMEYILDTLGLSCELASSGKEAVNLASQKRYAAILMDVMMPGMDGYEATQLIRKQEFATGQHTPIIAVTALDLEMAKNKCLASGMDDFITKPVGREILTERLKRWLQQPVAELLTEFSESISHAGFNPINRERLKLLYGTDKLSDILKGFISANEALLKELKTAINLKDPFEASRVAHELKGSAFAISAEEIAALARKLELAARSGEWQEAISIYAGLAVAFLNVQDAIEESSRTSRQ